MNKVYFFFTKINNSDVRYEELQEKGFFNEYKKIETPEGFEREDLGFNHSYEARITQLYFQNNRVAYHYVSKEHSTIESPFPLVFLICDNQYRDHIDKELSSLFKRFLQKKAYCYFHKNNASIKTKILEAFGDNLFEHQSFHHRKDEPFFELPSLLDVKSTEEFQNKVQQIQDHHLGTDKRIKLRKILLKNFTLIHKILAQSLRLKNEDRQKIQSLMGEDFTYQPNLNGLIQLRDHLLKAIE